MSIVVSKGSILEKIKGLFNARSCVEIAYLFGSMVNEKSGKLSDVDIGVYFNDALTKEEREEEMLSVISEIISLLKTDKVDVVVMNDAPVSLNYEIIKYNAPIFVRDEGKRVDVEQTILSRYLDRRYYEKMASDIFLRKVMEEGITY